jgi:hypothetical protein
MTSEDPIPDGFVRRILRQAASLAFIATLAACATQPASVIAPEPDPDPIIIPEPRIALVLGGGAAKGFSRYDRRYQRR